MLDLSRVGSKFLVALLMVNCSSNDSSESEDTSSAADTGTPTATSGMGAANTTTATTGAAQNASVTTSAGPSSTTGVSMGGDSGGSGGSGDGPSTMGGPGNTGFGFGFGAGGTSGAGGSGGSGSGGETSVTAASTTGAGSCTPAVECEPEPLPSTGDPHQDCVDRVNQFRVGCWCLPALERWTEGEDCANEHAQYDSEDDRAPHSGFVEGICDNGGNAQNECPGWGSETQIIEGCLQMMYDEGPPPEPCNDQCYYEHGHFINMTNERYTQVACGFYTTPGGDVWSVQNFR